LTGKKSSKDEIHTLNIYANVTSDWQIISDSCNEHFSSIAEIIYNEVHNKLHIDTHRPIYYEFNSFKNLI